MNLCFAASSAHPPARWLGPIDLRLHANRGQHILRNRAAVREECEAKESSGDIRRGGPAAQRHVPLGSLRSERVGRGVAEYDA